MIPMFQGTLLPSSLVNPEDGGSKFLQKH